MSAKDITLTNELIFSPLLYVNYPYHWIETDEDGITHLVFSKKPRYTLLEIIEMEKKIKEAILYE